MFSTHTLCHFTTFGVTTFFAIFVGTHDTTTVKKMFAIPLNINQQLQSELANAALCYSVNGCPYKYFNLLSDKCVSVNAYYSLAHQVKFFNVISKIGITAVDEDGNCQNIKIDHKGCVATVGTTPVIAGSLYNMAGITVRQLKNGYWIVVPNCESVGVVMWVSCKTMSEANMLEFNIAQRNGLIPTSHGLVGKRIYSILKSVVGFIK